MTTRPEPIDGGGVAVQLQNGEVQQTQGRYFFPPLRDDADKFDEETVTIVGPTTTHKLQHARRSSQVNGWTFTMPGGLTDFSFVRRVGTGQAISLTENFFSKQPPVTSMQAGNPTMGGAVSLPYARVGADEADNAQVDWFSIPTHYRHGATGTGGFIESACIPLEFDCQQTETWGGISQAAEHEGGPDCNLLWHRMRMFQRLDLNLYEENLHRLIGWSYAPFEVRGDDGSQRTEIAQGLFLEDWFSGVGIGEAWWYSPYTNTLTSFENIFGTGVTWAGSVGSNWWHTFITPPTGSLLVTGDQAASTFFPVQSDNNLEIEWAFILRAIDPQGVGQDFCIGFYVRMTQQIDTQKLSELLTTVVVGNWPDVGGGGRDNPAGPQLGFKATNAARPAGWLGQQIFIATDTTVAGVAAKFRRLFESKRARQPVPFLVPEHVQRSCPPLDVAQ